MVKGGYYHAGQVCVSTQRILVHEEIKDAFVERFTARVSALRVGDPLLQATEVGPLIHPKEVERVASWIDQALAGGAQVATGGRRLSETTYEPTILVEPPPSAKVSSQEIFGPLTCIYGYTDLDQAIGIANALPVTLQASIFAQDLDIALHAADRLDASVVMINDHTAFRTDWLPFAGRRQSGYGTGGIPYSMLEMTQEKMIVLRRP
jgi:acyl-CoA reductase-like NAD-dependent aldehyde dehydrogenase